MEFQPIDIYFIEDINEIEVNNPIHIIPVTEFNGSKSNKSSCDDYSKPFNSTVDDDVKESELILNPLKLLLQFNKMLL